MGILRFGSSHRVGFVAGYLAVGLVLLASGLLAVPAAASGHQQEDGGNKPTTFGTIEVRGTRPGPRAGGLSLTRYRGGPVGGGAPSAPPVPHDNQRDTLNCDAEPETDQPVVISSGNKVLDETDFATADGLFSFTRTYSRQGTGNGFGAQWRHPYSYALTGTERHDYGICRPGFPPMGEPCPLGNRFIEIFVRRPDGVTYLYTWNLLNGRYEDSRPESTSWIEEDEVWTDGFGNYNVASGGFRLHREDGGTEQYEGNGKILFLGDSRGVGYAFA